MNTEPSCKISRSLNNYKYIFLVIKNSKKLIHADSLMPFEHVYSWNVLECIAKTWSPQPSFDHTASKLTLCLVFELL